MRKVNESEWLPINEGSPLEINVDENTQVRVYGVAHQDTGLVEAKAEIWKRESTGDHGND